MATWTTVDGNGAVARVAYALSEVIAIYPITPASPMGEAADAWAADGRPNLWGVTPEVVEMQSEGGAAGALHGAAMRGALATTFTSSQGLLLMVPNMYKLAGELTPAVIHVAARALATHALSIFGDHSDVMAVRQTGWAMLSASSVQEAHDFALVAHAATLRCRVPFLHFFDGFRTSHEMAKIETLDPDTMAALVDEAAIVAMRERGLDPDHPTLRGSAQNPDVFFQAREAATPWHAAVPSAVQQLFDELGALTGRRYALVDYHGAPDAERVIVVMGSAGATVRQAVAAMNGDGERVGVAAVRLYRPFPSAALVAALPATVRRVAVLDRTKEPGSVGEPLYQDVVTALAESDRTPPCVTGGRYGLGSKEFTPAMAKAVFDELDRDTPRRHFTVGIVDDVSQSSLDVDAGFTPDDGTDGYLFYGLGSDGTVGAAKTAVSLIAERDGRFAQGYFVYDSKKSGSLTVSHLRVGDTPIDSPYLVRDASLVVASHFNLTGRVRLLEFARDGATLLLNSPHPADVVWDELPVELQEEIVAKDITVWTVDAAAVAHRAGMGRRVNTVMLPCALSLAGVLPPEDLLAELKEAVARQYAKRGDDVVARNQMAVDAALAALERVAVPAFASASRHRRPPIVAGADAGDFVTRVTARLLAHEGDRLPVSALPVDGRFPTGTAQYEKRSIASELPVWDPDICIDCAKCTIVCAHAAIRMKVFAPEVVVDPPAGFLTKPFRSKDVAGHRLAIQVAPDDCTGCAVCVDVCPVTSKTEPGHKALVMAPVEERIDVERTNWDYFLTLPDLDRDLLPHDSVKGSQVLEPLFEFSGACAGCGETPYLKLLTQLFGDRIIVANATGCSSIFGGNLPTTPWARNREGRGPAWANSLFEDNAEFGLGIRLAVERQQAEAIHLVEQLAPVVGDDLATAITAAARSTEPDERAIEVQRGRVAALLERLRGVDDPACIRLMSVAGALVRKSVWIVGGDGWAYDIGAGGLDHVLASGRDVNILVLDSEVYSNTGGQASKATPRGAVARFAASGKSTPKKDLGLMAASYGNVFVAQIALGANDVQATKAFVEADAWPGPSLIVAYSTCVEHGIDMATSMSHQKDAVRSGYWPLYRFRPDGGEHGHPLSLDSHAPTVPLRDFARAEDRFAALARREPEHAEELLALAQADVDERWRLYEQLAGVERTAPAEPDGA